MKRIVSTNSIPITQPMWKSSSMVRGCSTVSELRPTCLTSHSDTNVEALSRSRSLNSNIRKRCLETLLQRLDKTVRVLNTKKVCLVQKSLTPEYRIHFWLFRNRIWLIILLLLLLLLMLMLNTIWMIERRRMCGIINPPKTSPDVIFAFGTRDCVNL